jgi:hypothetical protein
MRVLCRSGHFAFYPFRRDEVIRFQRVFKLALFAEGDYFTFKGLLDLPRWSQTGQLYGTLPAVATYEGRHAYEVMRENEFVYSLATGFLIPSTTVSQIVSLPQTLDCAIAPKPLIQPGAILSSGETLIGYEGDIDLSLQRLYVYAQETLP